MLMMAVGQIGVCSSIRQLRFFANGDDHHSLGHRPRIIRFAQRGVRQSALFSPISRSADGGPQVPAG
jgi:hypothetical protein